MKNLTLLACIAVTLLTSPLSAMKPKNTLTKEQVATETNKENHIDPLFIHSLEIKNKQKIDILKRDIALAVVVLQRDAIDTLVDEFINENN